jgi:AraC-like DNA-binding protein
MIDPLLLDAMVRGVAVGGFATIGVSLAVSRQPTLARWIGAVFFLAAIGHVIDNCAILQNADSHVDAITRALSIMGPGMFWAFALTLFGDERRVTVWGLGPPVTSIAMALLAGLAPRWCASPLWAANNLFSILLVVASLAVIWRGWRDDLVMPRRRLRAPVMGAAALYVLVIASQDMGASLGFRPLHAPLIQAFLLAALAVAGAVALLRPDPVLMGSPAGSADASRGAPPPEPSSLDPADRAALVRLDKAMDEEQIWRREDLSVRVLADHVALPEHRLRRLINGALGHRNFAAFVNARRVEAAKQALGDPAQLRTPVSAIAYELGFGSLGPFNRAFKDATGVTPTAWRQAAPRSPNPGNPGSI